MEISKELQKQALIFIKKNKIVKVGDNVETLWGGWKKPKIVKISGIGAEIAYNPFEPCKVFFQMYYIGLRLKSDGTLINAKGCGIVLDNIKTYDNKTWKSNLKCFNHCGLSWEYEEKI